MEEPNSLYLPPEIMDDIILRLPAKSLCRFKCVSKPWLSQISNPDFVKRHIRGIENKDVFVQRRRVIFTDAADNGLYTMNLDEFLKNHNHVNVVDTDNGIEQVAATELDYVYRDQPSFRVPFFRSCNGVIFCQLSNMELYLVNPATSESKQLAAKPRPYGEFWSHNYKYKLYGFDFDSSTSEYQLIQGDIYIAADDIDYEWQGTWFSAYNFKTDSWRYRSAPNPYIPVSSHLHRNEHGVLLNGRFHWLMEKFDRDDEDEAFVIISFNEAVMMIQKTPLPLELSSGSHLVKLGAFREWLCITLASPPRCEETYNEFWVMKEYGVTESWTKMRVSIPYTELSHSGFWTESHDLMVFGERLVLYNFDDEDQESFRNLSVGGEIGKVGRVGVYIESLVSLGGPIP